MAKRRISALILIAVAAVVGYFVYQTELVKMVPGETASSTPVASVSNYAFKLGLDLNGGTHLVYRADTSKVLESDINSAMTALRDVIERRVNMFGVSEPLVQVEEGGVLGSGREERLIVELPGVTDVKDAVAMIGQTPLLEFKLANEFPGLSEEELQQKTIDEVFSPTGLTGQYLKRATLTFDPNTGEPQVTIDFNSEGKKMFGDITRDNIGRVVAIFLDGVPISTPVIREVILEGTAQISGNFKIDEARTLVRNLNYGALPMPISLVSTETIGPSLGTAAVNAGLKAGLWSFVIIAIFLIVWYRLPGLLASIALLIYVILNLAIFKLIPVTLTAAGIAGFVLSLGMAVDANILIFERMKEEFRLGKELNFAIDDGFARAWPSIRDSNISTLITTLVLYYFTTSVVKGFALTLGIGVIVSMFSAIVTTRSFLKLSPINFLTKHPRLMGVK